jgi:dipicolinate synthase subunit A
MILDNRVFYIAGNTAVTNTVDRVLTSRGLKVAETPSDDVTHLILGVPCRMDGKDLEALLAQLPKNIRVLGGFLDRLELQGYACTDLLKDELYLAKNAAITAQCALQVAMERLPVTFHRCPVLILGSGRISLFLAPLLQALGADVVIAARNPAKGALLQAQGYETEVLPLPEYVLPRFRVIFNTVPAPLLSAGALEHCRQDCLKIELASFPGMAGDDVIDARGLPGKLAPESSGKLIAQRILQLCAQKEAKP